MRTKALLITAALGMGVATASAQDEVFSINAVGYVNTPLASGFNLISNPLNNGDNTAATVLGDSLPLFASIQTWNGSGFDVATHIGGGNWNPNPVLEPGSGFFVEGDGNTTVTFVGEVPQGDLVNPIPAGFSIASSQVPQAGDLTDDLGLTLALFDSIQVFDTASQSFVVHTFTGANFAPAANIGVGQAFFVNSSGETSWDRAFDVNAQ